MPRRSLAHQVCPNPDYALCGRSGRGDIVPHPFMRLKRGHADFDGRSDWGAWEVAARCSHLDLDDPSVDAGTLTGLTLGLNRHLNPNVRVMWDYIHSVLDTDTVDEGDADLLMVRLQVEFWTRQRCGRLRGCRRVDRVPEGRSVVSGST